MVVLDNFSDIVLGNNFDSAKNIHALYDTSTSTDDSTSHNLIIVNTSLCVKNNVIEIAVVNKIK